jgi:hypothetical protein
MTGSEPARRASHTVAPTTAAHVEVAEAAESTAGLTLGRAQVRAKPVAARRGRLPADDPLSAERTRWLVDEVGGVRALAGMLGVNPSQPSQWAAGRERPGADTAPRLIDLEHVLARVRLVWGQPASTTWMTSANSHLGGARPVDVLALRGPSPVLDALDADAWGSGA